jgi:hypothetical protein
VAEHSREFPEEDGEAARTVAVAAEEEAHIAVAVEARSTVVVAAAEEKRTAAVEAGAHTAVVAVVVTALFVFSVRISPELRLSQRHCRRTLPWRAAGRSYDDAASQYLERMKMAG